MKVIIRNIHHTPSDISLDVELTDTVFIIKQLVFHNNTVYNQPINTQILEYNNTILYDNKTLEELGICIENTIITLRE